MKKNINESNVILVNMAHDLLKQGSNASKYPSLEQTLADIEARAKEVVLSGDELSTGELTSERQSEETKIDAIIDAVKGIAYIHQKELLKEDWLKKSNNKTNKDFFDGFFAGVANAPKVIRDELATIKSGAYANYSAVYDAWKGLVEKEELGSERGEKINEAIDIRAGLIGVCRMLGATNFDIERNIAVD